MLLPFLLLSIYIIEYYIILSRSRRWIANAFYANVLFLSLLETSKEEQIGRLYITEG